MPIKNNTPDSRIAEMRERFLEACGDLWDVNQDRFMALLNSSEQRAVKLTFGVAIDMSESKAAMDVEIGYGQRYKDKRVCSFDDPDQTQIEFEGRRPGTGLPEMNVDALGEPVENESNESGGKKSKGAKRVKNKGKK